MSIDFVGIGDLHYDGKLSKFIPSLNRVISQEVRKPLNYARSKGINNAIFYGDIADKSVLSDEATLEILNLLREYPEMHFTMIKGNHDTEDEHNNSLRVLKALSDGQHLTNLTVATEPCIMHADTDHPIKLLPWPSFATDKDCLNVIHIETNGAQWEHGVAIESDRETEAWCVGGHLHTKQICGPRKNIFFSGTLYQTNFGEKEDKYFHHVRWDGEKPRVKYVPTKPVYTLRNLVINSRQDLSKIERDPYILYKVLVRVGADLHENALAEYPNVVKFNPFKTAIDLKNLLAQELYLDEIGVEVTFDTVQEGLEKYLVRANVDPEVRLAATRKFKHLVESAARGG